MFNVVDTAILIELKNLYDKQHSTKKNLKKNTNTKSFFPSN